MSFHSRKQPSARVLQPSLSFAVLVHIGSYCPALSSLKRRFRLPTDLTARKCHTVLQIVHLLSFTRAMCPTHFHFTFVKHSALSVTLDLHLMVVFRFQYLPGTKEFNLPGRGVGGCFYLFVGVFCLFVFVFCILSLSRTFGNSQLQQKIFAPEGNNSEQDV